MTLISNNIKFLRKLKGWTQEELAEKIGIKRSLIGAYEEGRADPRLNNLTKMVGLFETTVDKLISHDISRLPASEWNTSGTKRGKEVLAITVGEDHRENIELVPQKAAAGYLNG
ncbi:MAG: helix-turn-helix transcriptional regulator, partial [Cyclobacteriaceae bacterium]|nr:helix-turn-helix transcriptional regulator [Cyclobacteriaceae bacterium]